MAYWPVRRPVARLNFTAQETYAAHCAAPPTGDKKMDYTRPNHIPTPEEEAAEERTEYLMLKWFAVLAIIIVVMTAVVFSSKITGAA